MAAETIDPAAVEQVKALAEGARRASRQLALLPRTAKDEALHAIADGLVAATGHGSEGVILGGGSAELVAQLVLGETPWLDPAPFSPDRFDARRGGPSG